ncbi:B3 domain-containing protein Os03g0619600-like isoform X2 [Hordeum vulgare subsp. vulgare]|uniref:B3 domain-containing protein Os03g0619600-like isoform X2 n=1 Tax=Hordeum vulgare subsp. vulgare TaxID=112509 RepID=UPI001D1A595B|nr:B3 domain-containing protein Os03g0619600-like isoform X2 [Hordeum vulgare subsp. vulgare]
MCFHDPCFSAYKTLTGGEMSNSCECCKRYWTHLHGKVKCFFTHMDRNSGHSMVMPESFVNCFAWKLSGTIELEAPNGNVYDVRITERRNKTLLRSGWGAFVDANHIVESDSLMFRHRGNCRFKVVVFDSSGCEKVVSCARRQGNTNDQAPSTNSTDILTSFTDGNTHSSARGRSDDYCRKRAKKDAIAYPSEGSSEDSPYEHQSSESDDQMLPTPVYVLSGKCYVTDEDEASIIALAQEIQPEMPLLVVMMTKPSVKPYPDLVIPKDYALAHFPRKNQTIKLQLPDQSKKWYCEFRVKSDGGHFNLKECGFARDNHLLEGDMCVFHPMMNRKGRTFKVMVHLLCKASIDHTSSKNGLTSKKNVPTLCIKEDTNEGEEIPSLGHEEHGINDEEPYMMPRGTCLTRLQKKKVLGKVEAIGSDLHIYIAVMTRSSILVSLYSATYLREGSGSLVLQVEGKSQVWHDEMREKGGAMRIRAGWTSFASDNNLREGDICLFELMKNEGGPKKMMVYIIRRELC